MKKIFYFALLVSGCLFTASCSSDNDYSDKFSSVQVTEASTFIDAKGGTKTIKVNIDGVTATSADAWLTATANGNTISITATENLSRETRHTTVTIKASSGDQQIVSVSQMGTLFMLSEKSISLSDDPETASVGITHDAAEVSVESLTSWISAAYNAASNSVEITTAANNTGVPRTGYLTVTCGNYSETLTVNQFDFEKDVLGEYYFMYYRLVSGKYNFAYTTATLTEDALVLHMSSSLDFTIPVKFTNGKNEPWEVTVDFGNYVGPYATKSATYEAFIAFDRSNYNFLGRYPEFYFNNMGDSQAVLTIKANVEETEEGPYTWYGGDFEGEMNLDGDSYGDITHWNLLAMTAKEFSQDAYAGIILQMFYPGVQKIEMEESAAPRRAKQRK